MDSTKLSGEEIKAYCSYLQAEETDKFALENAAIKRKEHIEEVYRRLVVLKQDLFEDAKYDRSINLCKLLKTINNSTGYFSNELIESAEKKKEEFEVLKQELEKEITYLNNNNQKEKANKYLEAITIVKKEKISNDIKIGSIINFGNYPQDAKRTLLPIKWRIIDIKENKILLITEEAIDCKKYNETMINVTWETCTLRKWLNTEFIDKAFNDNEKSQINLTDVIVHENPKYNRYQGNNTKDKVFLLSIKEAEEYFKNDEARKCVPTDFVVKKRVYQSKDHKINDKGTCWYWLRSLGNYSFDATVVEAGGSLNYYGCIVNYVSGAVRPALWLNI